MYIFVFLLFYLLLLKKLCNFAETIITHSHLMICLNPEIDASQVKILIVDDIPLNVLLIDKMLAKFKFNILKANSGADALQIIENEKPNVLLLDLMMPGIDGYQVTEQVRRTIPKEEMPIVILSALNSNDDINRAMALGADEFITKPVMMERLHSCVVGLVNRLFQ